MTKLGSARKKGLSGKRRLLTVKKIAFMLLTRGGIECRRTSARLRSSVMSNTCLSNKRKNTTSMVMMKVKKAKKTTIQKRRILRTTKTKIFFMTLRSQCTTMVVLYTATVIIDMRRRKMRSLSQNFRPKARSKRKRRSLRRILRTNTSLMTTFTAIMGTERLSLLFIDDMRRSLTGSPAKDTTLSILNVS